MSQVLKKRERSMTRLEMGLDLQLNPQTLRENRRLQIIKLFQRNGVEVSQKNGLDTDLIKRKASQELMESKRKQLEASQKKEENPKAPLKKTSHKTK